MTGNPDGGRSGGKSRRALLLLALAAAGACLVSYLVPPRPRRPNIILIVWDTCRIDRLSAFGFHRPTTPWLEEFSRGAVRYTGCIAPAPWTPPSHASLFTGLRPSHHGLRAEMADRVHYGIPLLAETLRDGGYATVGVSANGVVSEATGLSAGFASFSLSYVGEEKPSGARTAAVVREAVERVLPAEKPLFLFVNFMDAHLPHHPPPEALAALGLAAPSDPMLAAMGDFDTNLAMARSMGRIHLVPSQVEALRDLYDADLRNLDGETGALFEWLEEKGLLDGSFIVVTADHGENLGEHGEFGHRLSLHEPLLRVPLVVRWPDGRDAGTVVPRMVSLMDLHPTILAAAVLPVPPLTGLDAVPLTDPVPEDRPVFAEHGPHLPFLEPTRETFPGLPERCLEPLRWMYQAAYAGGADGPEWKLERRVRVEPDGTWSPVASRLFHLPEDPGEQWNLLRGAVCPEVRGSHRELQGSFDEPTLPPSHR